MSFSGVPGLEPRRLHPAGLPRLQALFLFALEQLMDVLDEKVLHGSLIADRVFLEASVKVGVDVHLNPLRAPTGITHHVFDGLWGASG